MSGLIRDPAYAPTMERLRMLAAINPTNTGSVMGVPLGDVLKEAVRLLEQLAAKNDVLQTNAERWMEIERHAEVRHLGNRTSLVLPHAPGHVTVQGFADYLRLLQVGYFAAPVAPNAVIDSSKGDGHR